MNKDYMTGHCCAVTADTRKPLINTLLTLFAVCLFTAPLYLDQGQAHAVPTGDIVADDIEAEREKKEQKKNSKNKDKDKDKKKKNNKNKDKNKNKKDKEQERQEQERQGKE